jgi:hypothetical protein
MLLRHSLARTALVAVTLAACAPGEGTLDVSVYGEEFIDETIPADVFVDGWTVTFDKFLVSVGDVALAQKGSAAEANEPRFQIFDLSHGSKGAGFPVTSATVGEGAYDDLGFRIAPAKDAVAGNASADDVTLMRSGGFSVYAAGKAERAGTTKVFTWGFATNTHYTRCESTAVVGAGETAASQLTIHGDHLFYDDLFAAEPNVAFDLIAAADADADGVVTPAELAATDIRALADYQVGDLTHIVDLWAFIEQQTTTLGHIDGEGHCEFARED